MHHSGTLRVGSRGERVAAVQEVLASLGYRVTVDGVFGRETEAAVREFQRNNGLTPDGVVGPATLNKLVADDARGPGVTPEPAPPAPGPAAPAPPTPTGQGATKYPGVTGEGWYHFESPTGRWKPSNENDPHAKYFKPLTGVWPPGQWEYYIDESRKPMGAGADNDAAVEQRLRTGIHAARRDARKVYFEFGSEPLVTIEGHGVRTVPWRVNGQSVQVVLSVNPTISNAGSPGGVSVSASYNGRQVFSKFIPN